MTNKPTTPDQALQRTAPVGLIAIALLLFAALGFWLVFVQPFATAGQAQREVTALSAQLDLNQTQDQVRSRFKSGNFSASSKE
jgi:hypothetical protein